MVNAVPADGFSFNWGSTVPATTIGGAEDGAGNGLSVTFDTYDNVDANPDNGVGEAPTIGIKYNGAFVVPEKMVTRATLQPADWAQVGIRVSNAGLVDVMFNGAVIFRDVQIPGWTGLPNGRFNIAARTGGANETHWIDSLVINTTNFVGPISFTQEPANSAGFLGSTVTFTAQVNDPGQTTWQWQAAPAGTTNFAPIPAATTNSYTTPALTAADAGRRFRVVAQGLSNQLTSNFAVLSVEDPSLPTPTVTLNFDDPTTVTYAFLGSGAEQDNGGVGDSRTGALTTAVNSLQGTLTINDFNSGAPVSSMYASFQLRIGGGTATPADGVAFVWADDVTATTSFGEEGSGSGLTVSFDTYDNTALPNNIDFIGLTLKWQGNALAEQPLPTSAFLSDPDYYPVVVKVDADGTADVWYNNIIIFNNIALPGFAPVSGANFAWGGRTGGLNENNFIDDIKLFTATAAPGGAINIQVVGANIVITYTWDAPVVADHGHRFVGECRRCRQPLQLPEASIGYHVLPSRAVTAEAWGPATSAGTTSRLAIREGPPWRLRRPWTAVTLDSSPPFGAKLAERGRLSKLRRGRLGPVPALQGAFGSRTQAGSPVTPAGELSP